MYLRRIVRSVRGSYIPWLFYPVVYLLIRSVRGFFTQPAAPLAAQQAIQSDGDKGEAEQLALVQPYGGAHRLLPRFLHFLAVLYNQAEREDGSQAVAKEEAGADAVLVLAVE